MPPKLPALSLDDLSKVLDFEERQIDIESLNASVTVKAFTVEQRDSVVAQCTGPNGKVDGQQLLRLLVIHGVVSPKFTPDIVAKMPFLAVDEIATAVMELNGMDKKKGASAATVADVTF